VRSFSTGALEMIIDDDDDYQDGRLLYDLIHFTDNSEGG